MLKRTSKQLTEDAMRVTASAFYSLIEADEQVESMELVTRIDGRPVRCRVEISEIEQSFSHAIKSTMTTWQEAEDAVNAARDAWLDSVDGGDQLDEGCDRCDGEGQISVPTARDSGTVAKRECAACSGRGFDQPDEDTDYAAQAARLDSLLNEFLAEIRSPR